MEYKLELHASSRVHPVFHVSWLNKVIGDNIPIQTIFLELDEEGKIILDPAAITNTRVHQLRNRSILEYLITRRNYLLKIPLGKMSFFIQKHPKLLKRCKQHLTEGEGHVKL